MLQQYIDSVLRQHGVPSAQLLGEGVEALVYELDADRVIRFYKQRTDALYQQLLQLRDFYDALDADAAGLRVPKVLEVYDEGDYIFTIDQRLPDKQLGRVLAALPESQAWQLLEDYLFTASRVSKLHRPFSYYGEVLGINPVRTDTWPTFISQKVASAYALAQSQFDQAVGDMASILTFIEKEVQSVAAGIRPLLVHGDFNAMNTLLDGRQRIFAVADFGSLTLAGDPRMDLACGIFGFMNAEDGMLPEHGRFLLDKMRHQHGEDIIRAVHVYRLYYAIVFASTCKESDPRTYKWSMGSLRSHLSGQWDY
ncbi:MAG TPA: aminoglycoside phosphotransferase family protein [Candidatus Saccharimonadales bacterium]